MRSRFPCNSILRVHCMIYVLQQGSRILNPLRKAESSSKKPRPNYSIPSFSGFPDPRKHLATISVGAFSTQLVQSQNSSADTLGNYRNLSHNSRTLERDSYRVSTHISAISQ
jgi:hypothetical protein